MSKERVYAAVDIGGTKVAAGLVGCCGEILFKTRVPMIANEGCEAGFSCVEKAITEVMANVAGREVAGIGICSPGPLDPKTGVVINPPNLPCWRNFPLASRISQRFSLPVFVENDANAAGLAEAIWGAGVGYTSVFYVTMGTGVGTGFVLDGEIYNGRTGAAPEGGHIPIDYRGPKCGCGKRGCIEALASGTAIAQRTRARIAASAGQETSMLELAGGDVNAITTEIVAKAWESGDKLATEILHATAEMVTIWLGAIIDVLEPEVIVFGGGVGELFSRWFPQIQEQLPQWSINQRCCEIPLKLARYSADAGIAGAAALCASNPNP